MRLNVGCGRHYAEGWVNTDLVRDADVRPDVVVDDPLVLPFPDDSCEMVYLGHVLEHVAWSLVPEFLTEIGRVLCPGGRLLVVGPDVIEAIDRYVAGDVEREAVLAVLEDAADYWEHLGYDWLRWSDGGSNDGSRHHWNCSQERVRAALVEAGWEAEVVHRLPSGLLDDDRIRSEGWPLVSAAVCQCSVLATKNHPV